MSHFPIHDVESAPEAAKPLLKGAQERMGFLPNLYRHMAEAPASLEGYLTLSEIYGKSSLSEAEQQIVLLAASAENNCDFCVAAHSDMAKNAGLSEEIVTETAHGHAYDIPDERLRALATFTRAVVAERGHPTEEQLEVFMASGYGHQQVLEVILGVTLKTLSNYTNHIAQTDLNEELKAA